MKNNDLITPDLPDGKEPNCDNVMIQKNPTELVLSLSLNPDHNKRMQLVYGSQLYGTFFGVFASFIIKDKKISGVKLQNINYKGIINLGIVGIKVYKGTEKEGTSKNLYMEVFLKAFQPSDKIQTFTFKEEFSVENIKEVIVSRNLQSFATNNKTGLGDNNMFDTEFYEKDGLYVREKKKILDQDLENWGYLPCDNRYVKPESQLEEEVVKGIRTTGGRCPRSRLIVVAK